MSALATLPVKILIVEDEMIIAANISLQLTTLGYEVSGIVPRGEEALVHIRQNKPDIVLLDIQLKGKIDGVETALLMQKDFDIPIIYLTANADDANFKRAKATHPHAFISKPFKKLDLKHAIELVASRVEPVAAMEDPASLEPDSPFILDNCIFVRHQEKMIKVNIQDILYVEAERNYCRIFSKGKEYVLVMTLKEMDDKLPPQHFLRVHRSFIVNISQIDEIAANHVVIAKKAIPLSADLRKLLLQRIPKL
jgi:DNA-binding LytR/AlgR family response regulator